MARYTGPSWKISRRLKYSISESGKELGKRPYAPGQHGQRRGKLSEYGIQLHEKQKVRFTYGVNEKQFRKTFNEAKKMPGKQGENFLFLLESRLDNLVFRAGLARTRRQARQLVNHGHVYVDKKRTDIPSYRVVPGQLITLSEKAQKFDIVKDALEALVTRPEFVSFDDNKFEVTYVRLPERGEILSEIKENLIVEYYNR
ncbi:30S ribosomal protein S4 [Candidatus Xianfuyuplasma coldseepsis]|uniref:Small ribosomal subunit protein uS4 n=1 Tax=Candidatus Xianfuyuplasma coldseepsis TaxID=2782163 RepID=A0A7L7KNV5_9MOLU|nr:30S ribosomal protein S4 [Xianfuyuplasma coldseepsis]QMS84373.1 30S ribosomal protein S4 [Xianfuyuplasma coldseepsis]